MTKEEARLAFQYPFPAVVEFALTIANLQEKEAEAIRLADVRGLHEERAAEQMDISVRQIASLKKRGYQKLLAAWDTQPMVWHMVEYVRFMKKQ